MNNNNQDEAAERVYSLLQNLTRHTFDDIEDSDQRAWAYALVLLSLSVLALVTYYNVIGVIITSLASLVGLVGPDYPIFLFSFVFAWIASIISVAWRYANAKRHS